MKKYIIALILLFPMLFYSCIDNFLEVSPKNLQTEQSAFQTNDNFKTYAWGLYARFPNSEDLLRADTEANVLTNNTSTNGNVWAYQKVTETTGNSYWNFGFIRKVNVMLDNIEKATKLTVDEKKHWRSVGLFFRSYHYFSLLSKYGDVPWVEHVIEEKDVDLIYGARDSRDSVAVRILRDLKYAEENIKVSGDGPNTINKNVVQALLSRFCLFEGTWRKHHGLLNAETYLNTCVQYSDKLMTTVTNINSSYDLLFNSLDLNGMPGVLLYMSYVDGIHTHQLMRVIVKASGNSYELNKQVVDKYLCSDGKPISTSTLYSGDKTPYDEFRNRDNRLYFTVVPPHRCFKPGSAQSLEWRYLTTNDNIKIGANPSRKVTATEVAMFREYMDLLNVISKPNQKSLPFIAWNNTLATNYTPRFRNFNEGIAPVSGQHGYWLWKWYDTNPGYQSVNHTDQPIFRIEETMMNYAEAKAELGDFTQADADRTINKLRKRVNVANMVVADVNDTFDPKRDQSVAPILWEIRRERTVELICEGYAFDDLRRWKKGHYLNQSLTGAWVKNVDYNNTLKISGYPSVAASAGKDGYVEYLASPLGWMEHYYLYPIPMNDLVLNDKLIQNPGYKSPTD